MKVKRGADVASDHHLLITRLKMRLKKNWMEKATDRKKYQLNLF